MNIAFLYKSRKTTGFVIQVIIVILAFTVVSCFNKKKVSVFHLNKKCKTSIISAICVDSVKTDTSSISLVEKDNLAILLPSLPDDFQGNVYYYAKKKVGKVHLYFLYVVNGDNRAVLAVSVIGREAKDNIEVANSGQNESFSFNTTATFVNDSTIEVKKYQCSDIDESIDGSNLCDSIKLSYRVAKTGSIHIISADTLKVMQNIALPNDDEYSDEVFFYNGAKPSSWSVAGIHDEKAFKNFFMEFRNNVQLKNKDAIANAVKFPINGITNEADFVAHYDKIFTKPVINGVIGQQLRKMFRDKNGVTIGDGDLLIREINGAYKIVAIKKH